MKLLRQTICFSISCMFISSIAFATTWVVDGNGKGDFYTIQEAINYANNGDEIIVFPGVYKAEQTDYVVNLLGKSLWLHAANGPDSTFIHGEGVRRGILCVNGETNTTVIEGFTIEQCQAQWFDWDGDSVNDPWETAGGGMGLSGSSPRVVQCVFKLNNGGRGGGGIFNYFSNPSIENCTFFANTVDVDGSGGGISNRNSSSPELSGCFFKNNTAGYLGGGMYNYNGSSPTLTNCTFETNTAIIRGGGLYSRYFSNVTINDCTFNSNIAVLGGGGIFCSSFSDSTLTNCTFVENATKGNPSNGGGMGISNSNSTLLNCDFIGNITTTNGGGLFCSIGCNTTITGCTFDNNSSANGGGLFLDYICIATIDNAIVVNNTATDEGGGLWCSDQSVVTLSQSSLQNNVSQLGSDLLLRKGAKLILTGTNSSSNVTLLHSGTTMSITPESVFVVSNSMRPSNQGALSFDIDSLTTTSSLIVNGTLERQGSLGVTNDSGSLSTAQLGDSISLMEVESISESAFDSIVLPLMPTGLGLQVVSQSTPSAIGSAITLEVVEDEGAEFDAPIVTSLTGTPVDIISLDIEGDGNDEIAILYGGSPSIVTVFAMATDGTPPVQIPSLTTQVGNGALDFDSGDLNGDGKEDIVVANADDGTISVLITVRENNSFIFSTTTIPVPGNLHAVTNIAVIDWDSNADADVVVGVDQVDASLQDQLQVLLNVASGSPTSGPLFTIPKFQDSFADYIDSSSSIDGLGSGFVCGTTFGGIYSASLGNTELQLLGHLEGNNITSIDAIDFDDNGGDGLLDLVIASDDTKSIYLMQGDASVPRGFGSLIPISISEKVYDVVVTDADGDGDTDFILATPEAAMPLVLLKNGGNVGLLPGGLIGRTWNKQGSGSETNSDKIAGGDLDDKGEDLDWDYVAGTSGQDNITGGPAGSVEQVNIIFTTCSADFNADDIVNVQDLLTLIAAWGPCGGCETDLNTDGDVNVSDLLILIAAWGPCGQ